MKDNQSGHHLPDAAGPQISDVPVANSGLQTHAHSTSDLLRLQILSKVNMVLSFLSSFKNIGQCFSSQLLGWTTKATTASQEMIEK